MRCKNCKSVLTKTNLGKLWDEQGSAVCNAGDEPADHVPIVRVKVKRTEIYYAYVDVPARSREQANDIVERKLQDGWDAIFEGDDGEYEECISEVDAENLWSESTLEEAYSECSAFELEVI